MDLKVIDSPADGEDAGGCGSGGCSPGDTGGTELPESVRQRVADHPCFSEQAHHHFARMHVSVAPACNIQCNFCNRKYDCANESRPGVVTEVLTPDQAVHKTLAVAARIPQMTVLGIAGPGDPLANPERTFETFRQLSEKAPDIRLCVSTNGLALPRHADELARHNIEHVTVTINAVDPAVGAQIHPWIYWDHRRVRGEEAARILIEQQLAGLERLVEQDVLVKVNSVLIPGVNEQHLEEVSRVIRGKGAFLHNVMPLIARPEHGTYYGVMGHPEPDEAQLQSVQQACSGDMAMMRHCQQCRADAVGLLGEDRGDEFTWDQVASMEVDYEAARERREQVQGAIRAQLAGDAAGAVAPEVPEEPPAEAPPMRMAVASSGHGLVDLHFGHADTLAIYEARPEGVRFLEARPVTPYCHGEDSCGEGDDALAGILAAVADCQALLCSRIGIGPWQRLEAAGVRPSGDHALEPIEAAVEAVYREATAVGSQAADSEPAGRARG